MNFSKMQLCTHWSGVQPENLPIAKAPQPEDIGLVSKLGLLLVMITTAGTIKVVRKDALFLRKNSCDS